MAGVRGRPTHHDEREGAARVDRDAIRVIEPGAAAGAVEVASRAAAGERGGRPGGDVDTADPLEELVKRRSGRTGNRCGTYAVCEAGVPSAGCEGTGAADAPRRARRCPSGRSRCRSAG
eukprot:scaffold26216_cov60-Phaeocystis_antarctica.AAC.1